MEKAHGETAEADSGLPAEATAADAPKQEPQPSDGPAPAVR